MSVKAYLISSMRTMHCVHVTCVFAILCRICRALSVFGVDILTLHRSRSDLLLAKRRTIGSPENLLIVVTIKEHGTIFQAKC